MFVVVTTSREFHQNLFSILAKQKERYFVTDRSHDGQQHNASVAALAVEP